MIRKSGDRLSEKIMLKQKDNAQVWFNQVWFNASNQTLADAQPIASTRAMPSPRQ